MTVFFCSCLEFQGIFQPCLTHQSEQQRAALQAKIRDMQRDADELRAAVAALEASVAEKARGLTAAQRERDALEARAGELEGSLADARAVVQRQQGELAANAARASGLEMQMGSVTRLLETANQERERARLQQEALVQEKESRIAALKAEVEEASRAAAERVERLQFHAESVGRDKSELAMQLAQTQAQLGRARESLGQQEARASELSEAMGRLRGGLAEKEAVVAQLRGELETAQEQRRLLQSQSETLKSEMERTDRSVRALNVDQEKKVQIVEGRYGQLMEELRLRIAMLETEVQRAREDVAQRDATLDQMLRDRWSLLTSLGTETRKNTLLVGMMDDSRSHASSRAEPAPASAPTDDMFLRLSNPAFATPSSSLDSLPRPDAAATALPSVSALGAFPGARDLGAFGSARSTTVLGPEYLYSSSTATSVQRRTTTTTLGSYTVSSQKASGTP